MADGQSDVGRLDSWKEIANHLKRDERTVKRWEESRGLPVRRIPGKRSGVYAFKSEIDSWLSSGGGTVAPASHPAVQSGQIRTIVVSSDSSESVADPAPIISQPAAPSRWNFAVYGASAVVPALIFIFIVYRYIERQPSLHTIQLSSLQQLTANGREKTHLLLDGSRLYFGQEQDGWYALAAMPAKGGPVSSLWNPQMNVYPEDITPDGTRLLALTRLGIEREMSVWIVPLDRGAPYRLSNLKAHSAAWSRDRETIAYATGESIYLISSKGEDVRKIASFTAIPDTLRWSADGRRLRFLLLDDVTKRPTYWELISTDGMLTTTLRPLPLTIDAATENWSQTTEADAIFVLSNGTENDLAWLQHGNKWWEQSFSMAEFHAGIGANRGIAYDPLGNRLYLLSESPARSVTVRFDPFQQQAKHVLPGVSAIFIDYSNDGRWIAYIRPEDQTLWVSHADGTEARQLTEPATGLVELPRWSPDGSSVAYMMKRPNAPWRIYSTARDGGASREVSEGNDNQGAPTWSPDGKYIVYGNVECQVTTTCAIHQIDLATRRVRTLPGSEGLGTARWSSDGRYIAAMQPELHQLFLFTTSTERWNKLADGINGTDLSWSSDSNFLYTNLPGNDARIVRISIADGRIEPVVDIRAQDEFNLADATIDLGFSLAPDNGVLMRRRMHAAEIYAYTIRPQ